MANEIKVLLVEDDEDDFLLAEEVFAELPYAVDLKWVDRYDDGLQQLHHPDFDIVFVDYRIGGHTGIEFLKAAKARGVSAPLVLLTGLGDRELDIAATEAGAADFLNKSELDANVLERTIRYAVAHAKMLQALAEKSDLLKTTLEHAGAGIAALSRAGEIVEKNARFDEFMEAVCALDAADAAEDDPKDAERLRRLLADIDGAPSRALEIEATDGRVYEARANDAPNGGRVVFALDVSAFKRQQLQLKTYASELEQAKAAAEFEAQFDSLTGLANRRRLDEHLSELARSTTGPFDVAILHIDLDRFKQINDTLGHAAGDFVLRHVADALRAAAAEDDFKARIGGDEFVIVRRGPFAEQAVCALAETIVKALAAPALFDGRPCRFGASVGVAFGDLREIHPTQLLVNADVALYQAKRSGRNRAEEFSKELQAHIVKTKRLSDEIILGLERDEFTPFFQPQFDAITLDLVGVEALARWSHPERGLLLPKDFLEIAEELNVVALLDSVMLKKSLAICEELRRVGIDIPKLSVNIGYRRLSDPALLTSLESLEIGATKVSLELLETIFLDSDCDVLSWRIDRIKEMGFEIEIDDFGTGRASVVGLLRVAPHRIKIDRELIAPVAESKTALKLVQSLIDIARSLDIAVSAEGVETLCHAEALKSIGCATLQGHAFAPAMSVSDLIDFAKGAYSRRETIWAERRS